VYFKVFEALSSSITERTKECEVTLNLTCPERFKFRVFNSTDIGWAQLFPGYRGLLASKFYFNGDPSLYTSVSTSMDGSSSSLWTRGLAFIAYDVPLEDTLVWSSCGGTTVLNVSKRSGIEGNSTSGSTAEASFFVSRHNIQVEWQPC
jgi:hypothetical protein